jgi:hypothetical protein
MSENSNNSNSPAKRPDADVSSAEEMINDSDMREMMKKEMLDKIENTVQTNPEAFVKALKNMLGKE